MARLRLYLAGPDVFRPDAVAQGTRLKALCAAHGVEGLYPLDGKDPDIRRRCIDMMDLVANITPFRGVHMDPGTAFEIGYAEARGKRVFLWSDDPRMVSERVVPAPDDVERDGDGHLIENFGKAENLMIVRDGARVWPNAEGAIREAATTLAHAAKNRQLQMTTRRSVFIAVAISLAVAVGAGWIVNRLVGW